jgi:hypothetical protein
MCTNVQIVSTGGRYVRGPRAHHVHPPFDNDSVLRTTTETSQ